jgi:hypothetical protein
MAAVISSTSDADQPQFSVWYSEYLTLISSHPGASTRLLEAIRETAGASNSEPRQIAFYSDTGLREDEQWEWTCALEATEPNVIALLRTGFAWEERALDLALKCVTTPELTNRIEEQKGRAIRKEAGPNVSAAQKRWWQFWRV